ncbi:MAG: PleD family two-component system response regulator [Desulfosudaceae bacterium]
MDTNITILVVDDEPTIRLVTARILRKAGYKVMEADSGESCLDMVRDTRPDLVVLDIVLPGINGYEVCRRIKEDKCLQGIYVLLLSGKRTESDDQSEGLEIGADGYVARPISNREFLARIQAMVRIIRAERERDRLIGELRKALDNIKTLRGLLPICCYCKKIRDDRGYWSQLEVYIQSHSEADFSHGICPECMEKFHPEVNLGTDDDV